MKLEIGYIDDRDEDIRKFKFKTRDDFEVKKIKLSPNIEEIIYQIIDLQIDAVVIDYLLNESRSDVHFNGIDIAVKLNEEMCEFPSFILTAFGQDAEHELIDVNKIYEKEFYYDNSSRLNRKIEQQIKNYQEKIKRAEEKILEFKNKDGITLQEKEKLVELDEFLVKTTRKSSKLPKELKENSSTQKLDSLINVAEEILKEVRD